MMERLLRAEQSSDLSEMREGVSDVDFLRAAGMVAQHHPIGMAVLRLVELGDTRAAREVFDGLVRRLVFMGHTSNPIFTASSVVAWMTHPTCPHCRGVGFAVAKGTGRLTDAECISCKGTGKAPKEWGNAAHDLYEWILADQRAASVMIARKLADE